MINAVMVPYVPIPCMDRISRGKLTVALVDAPPRKICNMFGTVDEKDPGAIPVANTGIMAVDIPTTGGMRASFPIVACKHSLLVHLDANPEASLVRGRIIFVVKSVKELRCANPNPKLSVSSVGLKESERNKNTNNYRHYYRKFQREEIARQKVGRRTGSYSLDSFMRKSCSSDDGFAYQSSFV
jgi:hypothetical protein